MPLAKARFGDAGVLTLLIPVAEQAKPRKITITGSGVQRQAINV